MSGIMAKAIVEDYANILREFESTRIAHVTSVKVADKVYQNFMTGNISGVDNVNSAEYLILALGYIKKTLSPEVVKELKNTTIINDLKSKMTANLQGYDNIYFNAVLADEIRKHS